ncbi:dihydroxyacetone kinase phosphoryl donor subunit DhaM [Actinacidiphila epipremni]|uniref:Phosphocarrier protein HPr n=1 Tax=Actinacidiphila epipremni TaxID=2053013 RepID=A0ABX0ZN03_9ACTN|nr:dihydroxyacetone kinase phosphoryl donor subunit DhaM [Actinacidiphila epipremni]NJP44631.1 hypothetical protein [Actinacidiphila epipremni]
MSVAIVVVSHSARLAEGAAELARAVSTTAVRLAVAAGIDDPRHPLGCDPLRVRAAIEEVDGADGVLVLMDLGSALLSAEFALGLLAPEARGRVLLCDAPFVEGLVAAAVASMSGAGLTEVAGHARAALQPKREHLAGRGHAPGADAHAALAFDEAAPPAAVVTFTVRTPQGLHARPAAAIVRAAGRRRATAVLRNLTSGTGPVPATSLNGLLTLGVRQGHQVQVAATGPEAPALTADLRALAARDFTQPEGAPRDAADEDGLPGAGDEDGRPAAGATGTRRGVTAEGVLPDTADAGTRRDTDGNRARPGAGAARARRDVEADRARPRAAAGAAAYTQDGVRIRVVADVGRVGDVADAEAAGADGIGVVRAESLFGGDPVLPGEDEQAALYARICSALPGRPVVLRTLDAGGDTAPAPPGLRGIRLTLRQPELMVPQLRAALRTAAAGHPLRLLLPMVTVADEIHRTRELLRQARADLAAEGLHPPGHLPLGITVDTPAAALKAGTLLGAADFVAIGTDDLTRYTLAAERGDADVAHLLREWDPAVLRLIASVAAAAGESGESGVPVAVLGAAARDPRMLPLLLGLGVRELAVPAVDIAAVKEQVRRLDTGRLAPAAARALRAGSAEEVLRMVDRMDPGLAPQNGET